MLPVLYEFPDDIAADPEKWENPENWAMVTPNAGKSITVARLIEDYRPQKIPARKERRRWASQHLNVQIGLGLRSDRWAGADDWEACGDRTVTLDCVA